MNISQQIKESVKSSPILVVDDDEMIRLYLATYLQNSGFQNIRFAENGAEALSSISEMCPACVVLDINMPVMDGYETLAHIRSSEDMKDLPVLVVTGHDSRDQRNNIMRAGASNLISKPIDGDVLVERVTNLIERELLLSQLTEFHTRLSTELSYAAEMQMDLLPTAQEIEGVETSYGVGLANQSKPSSELGGDSWAIEIIDESSFGILIVDFSGHGVSAALNTFRLHTVMKRLDASILSPAQYMEAINSEITAVMPIGQYCTMLYAVVNTQNDTLTFSAAAAPSPIIGQIDDPEITIGDGSGLPVGIRAQSNYVNQVVDFPPGSYLFLYSDALLETELNNGPALELEGIVELVKEHRTKDATASLNGLLEAFYQDAPDPLPDDLTAIWLSR